MTKTEILRNAAPKVAAPRKQPVNTGVEAPAGVIGGASVAASSTVAAQLTPPAPVAAPMPPAAPTDEQIIANTADKQFVAIMENLRRARIAQASQAVVEKKLKAEGISLDDINADHLAQQRLAELEQAAQLKAADVAARALFKAKYGVDSE